mmetsp:Transcript_21321/g.35258  ORF Transcript_21321/g.35258 Transcript_21321/m.35258 type:complete len:86 (-) Transcript_21321:257-514(-)
MLLFFFRLICMVESMVQNTQKKQMRPQKQSPTQKSNQQHNRQPRNVKNTEAKHIPHEIFQGHQKFPSVCCSPLSPFHPLTYAAMS